MVRKGKRKSKPYVGPRQAHQSRKKRDDSTPGPGNYEPPQRWGLSNTTIPQAKRPLQDPIRKIDRRDYQSDIINRPKRGNQTFPKERRSLKYANQNNQTPGPGMYDPTTRSGVAHSIPLSHRDACNKTKKKDLSPGPGLYDIDIGGPDAKKMGIVGLAPRFCKIPLSPTHAPIMARQPSGKKQL